MIDAYVASTVNKKVCATGVVVRSEKDEFRKVLKLKSGTSLNIAELEGAIFALEAVKPEFREETVNLHTRSTYVIGFTTRKTNGDWYAYPSKNAEMVDRFRSTLATFKDLKMVKVQRDHNMTETVKALIASA